ncbi:MAG: hypothetical protein HGA45_20960 [Chloroflexales bacterium]|nr:hypothetical protein [Chloroflexales bacterium]
MKAGPTRSHPRWPLALAFYLLLGLALTWPLGARPATDLPGGAHKDGLEDAYQNVWNLWWTVEALARPANLWATDRLFYPDGPNLLFHTLSPANTLMAAPITALWGPIAGFNAVALASFALGGLGMWLLARPRAGDGPALLAGIVYVASPFHMAALVTDGQLQIFALHWLPWYIYFLLEALAPQAAPRRARRDAALAGLFLVLTAWTDWYYTLFLLIFTAGALAWRLWRARGAGLGPLAARLTITAAVFTLGAAPLVVPMLIEAARADYMTILPPRDPWRLSADLLAYLVPPRLHALWGAAPWGWGVGYDVNRRFFLGLSVVALAALALWRRPAARPWGLAALAFAALSLGATLRINGADTGLPLPYALLDDLPIFRLTRQPDRFNVLVTIALGVLAAHSAAALCGRKTKAETDAAQSGQSGPGLSSFALRPASLMALLAALILLEYWPAPIVTRAPALPPYLAALPPGDGALIEYPFHPDPTYRDAERMLFQTTHGRPISGGYHSRAYPQPQIGLPALRDLRAGRLSSDIAREPGGWPAALRTIGYTHIIGYKQQPLGPLALQPADEAPFRALVQAGLGVDAPTYEDSWLIAYEVPPAEPAPSVQIRDGWGPVEEPAPGARTRWLPEAAELGLIVPAPGPYRLSFGALPAGGPRTLRVEALGGTTDLALASGPRRYSLIMHLPAGRTTLRLSTAEPPTTGQALEGNGDLRPISARFDTIGLSPMASAATLAP